MRIDIVIPTLNEAELLPRLLDDISLLATAAAVDVVVADGGSSDTTRAVAIAGGARVLCVPRGRARQLNAGAHAVCGEWLLFLHADCRLDAAARQAVLDTVQAGSELHAAVFRFAIDLPWLWKRFIEVGQAIREAVWKLPYGDQGLLIRRTLFDAVGGYPDLPLMEDVAMIQRLRRYTTVRSLSAALPTSGRRYRHNGVMRTWLKHTALITLYHAGVSPTRLARWRNG